ncbi:MAG: RNA polymerase sigma factor [Vicinamibacterales bacterium]
MTSIPPALVQELYRAAHAERWTIPVERFAVALQASADRAAPADLARYLRGLHLEDLALACGCAAGDERAWDHFMREHRPVLYRAADALDRSGGAREIADSIYAELYGLPRATGKTGVSSGVPEHHTERQSLFRYYHGRSSLKTWLRAVLSQRHVDGIRAARRTDPLPEEDGADAIAAPVAAPDPGGVRYRVLMLRAFKVALAALTDRDRLRLASYYSQQLTLAETGRILEEHEATVSRQLAKTRQVLRREIERHLKEEHRLDEAQIEQCFAYIVADPGPMDLGGMLRKNSASNRSI